MMPLAGCSSDKGAFIKEETKSGKAGSDIEFTKEQTNLVIEIRTNDAEVKANEITETDHLKETAVSAASAVPMYTVDAINVREGPSVDAKICGKLPADSEVPYIMDIDSEWAQIIFENEIRYAAKRYLTVDKAWKSHLVTKNGYHDKESVYLNGSWKYADYSVINSGNAVMYMAPSDRTGIIIGINAGHGTKGGSDLKTFCHPDKTQKVTGGTTAAGATKAVAVSGGMSFRDGTPEKEVTLQEAFIVRDMLLKKGYDVLMVRDGEDVQLDNVARTVICNNVADCHIAIHWDGDGLDYDKGCFYMSVPDGIKYLDTVSSSWQESERLGECCIIGLAEAGCKIFGGGSMDMDLTQTSYSMIPSIDIELGNQSSEHSEEILMKLANGIVIGIDAFFTP